jgi:serine/threonine-protein kinase
MTQIPGSSKSTVGAPGPDEVSGEAPPSADQVRAQLEKILSSSALKGSERLRRFLRLAVEDTLSGQGDRLKEYVLGVEALERPASFDPRTDPVVRVEARRLRAKLTEYYQSEGRDDGVVIGLPKGSYSAAFSRRPSTSSRSTAPDGPIPGSGTATSDAIPGSGRKRPGWRSRGWRLAGLAAAVLLVAAGGNWLFSRGGRQSSSTPTIAILPFVNTSTDQSNEYFCFGLVEDLTTTLAQTPGLRVVARTSAAQFTRAQDAHEIGRRLHADYIVEGSVRKVGDRLRITAQLISVSDGAHVWARAYDRGVSDLLSTQAELARAIALALGPRVSPANVPLQVATMDPETQELLLKGKYFLGVVEKQAPERALGYLKQAIERAPTYAPAHAAAAAAYAKITIDRAAPLPEEIALAKAEARRALELDAILPDAHALLAWISFFYDWNWTEAEKGFGRALAINPNSAITRHRYSLLLMSTRRFDEALAMSRKAVELDPISSLVASNRAMILLCARRFDEAIVQARSALELAPGGFTTYVYIGSSYAMKGMLPEAIAAYRTALAAAPGDPDAAASLGRALALSGRREEALSVLADLERPGRAEPASHYELAFLHAALGNRDAAFDALDASRARHETELVFLSVDPLFDQLRDDKRFRVFLDKLGFSR